MAENNEDVPLEPLPDTSKTPSAQAQTQIQQQAGTTDRLANSWLNREEINATQRNKEDSMANKNAEGQDKAMGPKPPGG